MALADIYQKATLVQIPSGYKAADAELYSVVPNTTAGDFTVSVDADATRVNKDGLVESVAANQARLDYDPTNPQDPHLLLEPSRTNLQIHSQEFQNSTWTKTRITATDNNFTAPTGSLEATKLAENTSGSNAYFVDDLYGATGGTYTFSCFLKKGTLRYAGIRALTNNFGNRHFVLVDLENGNVTSTNTSGSGVTWEYNVDSYSDGWYRLSVTGSHTSSNVGILISGSNEPTPSYGGVIPSYNAGGNGNFYVWGAQVEAGSYATSYIPTSGQSGGVTRTADTCGDAGNGTIIKAEGGLFVDFTTSNTDNFKRIRITDASDGNNSIFIQLTGTSFAVQIVSGGTTLYSWAFSVTLSNRHKIALRYKDGDSQLYYNGTQQTATTTSGTWFTDGLLDTFSLNQGSFFNFYGEIYQTMLFNEALSDSELQTLTS